MSDRLFLDTNVLVYLFDRDAPAKQERARSLLEAEDAAGRIVISTQVLQEFYESVTRKLGKPLSSEAAERAVRDLATLNVVEVDPEMILRSIGASRLHKIAFWDALIVEAALAGGCSRLLSEDLQHQRTLAGLRIENPFLSSQTPI